MVADKARTLAQLKIHVKRLIDARTDEYHGCVVKLIGETTPSLAVFAKNCERASTLQHTLLKSRTSW